MRPIRTEQDLDEMRRRNRAYATLSAWGRAGLLEALADGQAHTAAALPADPRAIAITAPVLVHLGLLVCHPSPVGTAWSLSPSARKLWNQGSLDFSSDRTGLDELARLDEVLLEGGPIRSRSGQSRVSDGGVRKDDPAASRKFIEMLHRRSAISAAETARVLRPLLGKGHALDLGGGHGRYGAELTREGARATLFDVPLCIDLARDRYGDGLHYIAGDFHTDDLGGPYDLILLSNIVHNLSPTEFPALLGRLRPALRPGGWLVLKDMFIDACGSGPERAACFGVVMLLYTAGGRSPRLDIVHAHLQEAGFPHQEHRRLVDQGFSLILAR